MEIIKGITVESVGRYSQVKHTLKKLAKTRVRKYSDGHEFLLLCQVKLIDYVEGLISIDDTIDEIGKICDDYPELDSFVERQWRFLFDELMRIKNNADANS